MITVAIIYHSSFGHTERQARAVADGAADVDDVTVHLMTAAEAVEKLDELDNADAIVFGSPTYMGNISADVKRFLEVAAKKWFVQAWKDKIAGAFTNSSNFSGDKLNTLMGLLINAMQHGMIFVGLDILPAANQPEALKTLEGPGPDAHNRVGSNIGPMAVSFQVKSDRAPSGGDIETAFAYGKRIAQITKQFKRGRLDD
jgi:NAD(P)H dehydrogenase (quinone)